MPIEKVIDFMFVLGSKKSEILKHTNEQYFLRKLSEKCEGQFRHPKITYKRMDP